MNSTNDERFYLIPLDHNLLEIFDFFDKYHEV